MISIHNNSDLSDFDAVQLVQSTINIPPQNIRVTISDCPKKYCLDHAFKVHGKKYLVEVSSAE